MRVQRSLALENVEVRDEFWSGVQNLMREVVIPYQIDVMEDKIPGIEKSSAIQNLRIAAGEMEGEFYGLIFQDSDVAKWLEAVAYSLTVHPDCALESKADEIIDLIGRAQQADGYINTYFIIKEPDRKWQNLHDCHELYCSGHMIEAAVAYYKATGKDTFLNIMRRNADLICNRFGHDKIRGIPGHQEIELALLRLYDVTGEKTYLDTAKYFIDERGTEPSYFEEEGKARDWTYWTKTEDRLYAQNHKPVREQDKAVGHSVRAVYMYTAMVALAAETDDQSLLDACDKLWDNITQKQMYITGGIGSTVHGEAFSVDYDLPNDTVYAETCASIAMCFFARQMLMIRPSGEYADILERMLYNTVLAGMQLDGKRFFYVNPLEVTPGISGVVQTRRHIVPKRPEWYACACCPPNVSRLLLSIGKYAWGEGSGTVYNHMFLGGSTSFDIGGGVKIDCDSRYPREGHICYTVNPVKSEAEFDFAIHIPGWCKNVTLSINGENISADIKDGYACISRVWKRGDTLEINAELPVIRVYSNLAVSGNAGQVCLQRGPIVYCFEEIDNGAQLGALRLPPDAKISLDEIDDGILKGKTVLSAEGIREIGCDALYTEQRPKTEAVRLQAVPYYTWGNRDPGEMRVWIRE
ncbi:MAG: glycoside hydrolase family 127 protein [Oscillospiraceae bacterium]|jgi:DUF1680 family protein|nr:glycoside hydrolase family 127 protein [Oscillospiraceae bacterium]